MRYAIGVDIGGTGIQIAYVKDGKEIIKTIKIKTEAQKGGQDVLRRIGDEIDQLIDDKVEGIGIGTAGQITNDGTIKASTANFKDWVGLNLKKELGKRFDLPIEVVNDVQAMALGEMMVGYNYSNMVSLALGTGVGGAIIANGKLYRGTNGSAGEIGHTVLVPDGRSCPCGSEGCVETYLSGTALKNAYYRLTKTHKDGKEIFEMNDEASIRIVEEFTNYLVITLSNIANTFAPDAIILSGGVAESLKPIIKTIEKKTQDHALNANNNIKVHVSKLFGDAMIIGAASTIFTQDQ